MPSKLKLTVSRLEVVAFVIGMVVLAFELTAARIIAPYLGDTIYTWTSVIGVILAALAFGYSRGGAWADSRQKRSDVVCLLLAAAVLITITNLTKDAVMTWIGMRPNFLQIQALSASLYLFAFPTFLLGAATPYLSRLSITDVATSGRRLSRIDAAGTIGSLVGTFLTGYVLFSLLGTRNLLTALSVTLVIVTFLITSRRLIAWQAGILGIILLANIFASRPPLPGFVSEFDSAYARYIVSDIEYEGRQARVLVTDENGLQSGIFLDSKQDSAFRYIRAFNYASDLRPNGQRYLIIGGGAFTFPETLARSRPQASIDTVEIDDRLPDISREYFSFQQPDNLKVITADGRQFLNTNRTKYDMIFLDAFNSIVPPFQLLTSQAAAKMEGSLTDDGIVVANIISGTEGYRKSLINHAYSSLRTSFPHVVAYQLYPELAPTTRQNLLVVASKQPITDSTLHAIVTDHPEFGAMTSAPLELSPERKNIMTDDYAPVEQMSLW